MYVRNRVSDKEVEVSVVVLQKLRERERRGGGERFETEGDSIKEETEIGRIKRESFWQHY